MTHLTPVPVIASADVSPEFREYERLATTVLSAYLTPSVSTYLRNLDGRPDDALLGVGISVEADTVLQGNLVEQARRLGLQIGWGKFLRDVSATGNLVRGAPIGIGISADPNGGYVFVTNNFMQGAKNGGIRAMDHAKPIGPDLTQASAESFRNFAVFANVSVP